MTVTMPISTSSTPFRLALLPLLAAAPAMAAVDYQVDVAAPSGLADLLKNNLELVSAQKDPDIDDYQLRALVKETPAEAAKLLETEGYFRPKISISETAPLRFTVKVEPGEPVIIDDVTIKLDGAIRQEGNFPARLGEALEAWSLPMGAPYRQSDWDASKRAVVRVLTADRFPLARITSSQAKLDPETGKGELEVVVDSGPLVRFGKMSITGNQRYPAKVAEGLADFKEGDPYQQKKLLDYQSALEQDVHYSGVVVSTDMSRVDADNRVPVDVSLTEFPRQKLELGLTYDSSDGPGVRLGYDHYNIFRRGFTGSMLVDWKQNDKNVSFGLGFPRQADGYSHSITSSWKQTDIQGIKTSSVDAGAWRIRARDNINARFGIEFIRESEEIGSTIQNDTYALLGVFGWTQRAVDDTMRPRNGRLLDVTLSTTLGSALTSSQFVRAYSRAVGYWTPLPKLGTFVARFEAGQVWTKDSNDVPTSQLFRAGGANSVRGYEYQSLGLPGPNGSVLGGRVIGTVSLEWQIPVAKDWAVALFHDAGNAADSWQTYKMEHSNGLGARWYSPVAPLSFDIAKAEKDGRLRWNMSLGLAF